MSLLMDALRKAEEAKKQAEQGDGEKKEQQDQQLAESVPPEQSEPVASDEPADDVGEDSPAIPDVALEFEPEPDSEPESASVPDTEQISEAVRAESQDSLSLEPIDEQLSQATRQPLDTDFTPDYSAESTDPANEAEPTKSITHLAAEVDEGQNFQSRDISATLSAGHEKLQAQQNLERAITAPQVRAGEIPFEPDSGRESEEHGPTAGEQDEQEEQKDKPKLTPQKETISERSAFSRSGAKNLFAAKRQGKRKRLRIRRSTKIWAAQITIVLMMMVGAYFYFFVVNSSTDNFIVPEQYLANQDSFSENFNESLEETTPVEEPIVEEVIPLDGDFDFEITDALVTDAELITAIEPDNVGQTVSSPEEEADSVVAQEPNTSSQVGSSVPEEVSTEELLPPAVEEVASGSSVAAGQLNSSQGATSSISFSRSQVGGGIDPVLSDAYRAFQQDNLVLARDLYEQVLIQSPRNRNALLGLAAIANRNGESSLALELYSRLLARDPSDAVARAGLMGIRPLGGPEQQERELRRLIELHPQVAPVAYALGNFYAAQDRWTDAQRYYFNALQQAKTDALGGLPVNPDYAFNLAVSLEHLNQGAAAETYYREAMAYATEFPASFDVSIARDRLMNLAEVVPR